ncbi:MAG: hypothetical protein ABW215_01170 [Kibdelosporangium sp.]
MRVRLLYVIVALFALAGCASTPDAPRGPFQLPPDEWASMRAIDACAILDDAALAGLGKLSDRKYGGASVHNCVGTLTGATNAATVIRAYVGERVAPDAKQLDLGGLTAFQDSSCAVTVKLVGDAGISISVQGYEFEKQCAQARDVATAVSAQLKSPPQNAHATLFHSKDPCQPVDEYAKDIGALQEVRRPTIINCELVGTGATLLISHEIESMTGHVHGEPLTVAGKEGMRHYEPEVKDRCEVMVLVKPAPEDSYFTTHFQVQSVADPCGKATNVANRSSIV